MSASSHGSEWDSASAGLSIKGGDGSASATADHSAGASVSLATDGNATATASTSATPDDDSSPWGFGWWGWWWGWGATASAYMGGSGDISATATSKTYASATASNGYWWWWGWWGYGDQTETSGTASATATQSDYKYGGASASAWGGSGDWTATAKASGVASASASAGRGNGTGSVSSEATAEGSAGATSSRGTGTGSVTATATGGTNASAGASRGDGSGTVTADATASEEKSGASASASSGGGKGNVTATADGGGSASANASRGGEDGSGDTSAHATASDDKSSASANASRGDGSGDVDANASGGTSANATATRGKGSGDATAIADATGDDGSATASASRGNGDGDVEATAVAQGDKSSARANGSSGEGTGDITLYAKGADASTNANAGGGGGYYGGYFGIGSNLGGMTILRVNALDAGAKAKGDIDQTAIGIWTAKNTANVNGDFQITQDANASGKFGKDNKTITASNSINGANGDGDWTQKATIAPGDADGPYSTATNSATRGNGDGSIKAEAEADGKVSTGATNTIRVGNGDVDITATADAGREATNDATRGDGDGDMLLDARTEISEWRSTAKNTGTMGKGDGFMVMVAEANEASNKATRKDGDGTIDLSATADYKDSGASTSATNTVNATGEGDGLTHLEASGGATNTNKATLDQRSGEVIANASAADDTDIGIAQARNDITRGEADGKITVWADAPEIAQNKVKSGTGDYDIEATTTTWRDKPEWNQANGGGGGEQALNNDIDRGAGDGTVDVIANGKYRADNKIKRGTGDGLVISDAVASAKDGGVARNTLDRSSGDGVVDLYAEGSKRAGNFVKRAEGDGETYLQAYAAGSDGRATNELQRGPGSGDIYVTTRGTAAVVNKIKTDDGFEGGVFIVGGSTNNSDAPAVVNDIDHKGAGDVSAQAGGRGAYNKITSRDAQGGKISAQAKGLEFAGNDYLIDDSVSLIAGEAIALDGNAVERSSSTGGGNMAIFAGPIGGFAALDADGADGADRMTIQDVEAAQFAGVAAATPAVVARGVRAEDAGAGAPIVIDRGAFSGYGIKFWGLGFWSYEEHNAAAGEWSNVTFTTWSFTFARNYLTRADGSHGNYEAYARGIFWAYNAANLGQGADGTNYLNAASLVWATNAFQRASGSGDVTARAYGGLVGWNDIRQGDGDGDVTARALGGLFGYNGIKRGKGSGTLWATAGSFGGAINWIDTQHDGGLNAVAGSAIVAANVVDRYGMSGGNLEVAIGGLAALNSLNEREASLQARSTWMISVGVVLGGFNNFVSQGGDEYLIAIAGGIFAAANRANIGNGDSRVTSVAVARYLAGNWTTLGNGHNRVYDVAVSGTIAANLIAAGDGREGVSNNYVGIAVTLPLTALGYAPPLLAGNAFFLGKGDSNVWGVAVDFGGAAINLVVADKGNDLIVNVAGSQYFSANVGFLGDGNNTLIGAAFASNGIAGNAYFTGKSGSAAHSQSGLGSWLGGFDGKDWSLVVEASYGSVAAINGYYSQGGSQYIVALAMSPKVAANIIGSGIGEQTILAGAFAPAGPVAINFIVTGGEPTAASSGDDKNIVAVAWAKQFSANLIFSGGGNDFIAAVAVNQDSYATLSNLFAISTQPTQTQNGLFTPLTYNVVWAGGGNNVTFALAQTNVVLGGDGNDVEIGIGYTNLLFGGRFANTSGAPAPDGGPATDADFRDLQSFHALDDFYARGDHAENRMVGVGASNLMLGSNGRDLMLGVATQSNIMGGMGGRDGGNFMVGVKLNDHRKVPGISWAGLLDGSIGSGAVGGLFALAMAAGYWVTSAWSNQFGSSPTLPAGDPAIPRLDPPPDAIRQAAANFFGVEDDIRLSKLPNERLKGVGNLPGNPTIPALTPEQDAAIARSNGYDPFSEMYPGQRIPTDAYVLPTGIVGADGVEPGRPSPDVNISQTQLIGAALGQVAWVVYGMYLTGQLSLKSLSKLVQNFTLDGNMMVSQDERYERFFPTNPNTNTPQPTPQYRAYAGEGNDEMIGVNLYQRTADERQKSWADANPFFGRNKNVMHGGLGNNVMIGFGETNYMTAGLTKQIRFGLEKPPTRWTGGFWGNWNPVLFGSESYEFWATWMMMGLGDNTVIGIAQDENKIFLGDGNNVVLMVTIAHDVGTGEISSGTNRSLLGDGNNTFLAYGKKGTYEFGNGDNFVIAGANVSSQVVVGHGQNRIIGFANVLGSTKPSDVFKGSIGGFIGALDPRSWADDDGTLSGSNKIAVGNGSRQNNFGIVTPLKTPANVIVGFGKFNFISALNNVSDYWRISEATVFPAPVFKADGNVEFSWPDLQTPVGNSGNDVVLAFGTLLNMVFVGNGDNDALLLTPGLNLGIAGSGNDQILAAGFANILFGGGGENRIAAFAPTVNLILGGDIGLDFQLLKAAPGFYEMLSRPTEFLRRLWNGQSLINDNNGLDFFREQLRPNGEPRPKIDNDQSVNRIDAFGSVNLIVANGAQNYIKAVGLLNIISVGDGDSYIQNDGAINLLLSALGLPDGSFQHHLGAVITLGNGHNYVVDHMGANIHDGSNDSVIAWQRPESGYVERTPEPGKTLDPSVVNLGDGNDTGVFVLPTKDINGGLLIYGDLTKNTDGGKDKIFTTGGKDLYIYGYKGDDTIVVAGGAREAANRTFKDVKISQPDGMPAQWDVKIDAGDGDDKIIVGAAKHLTGSDISNAVSGEFDKAWASLLIGQPENMRVANRPVSANASDIFSKVDFEKAFQERFGIAWSKLLDALSRIKNSSLDATSSFSKDAADSLAQSIGSGDAEAADVLAALNKQASGIPLSDPDVQSGLASINGSLGQIDARTAPIGTGDRVVKGDGVNGAVEGNAYDLAAYNQTGTIVGGVQGSVGGLAGTVSGDLGNGMADVQSGGNQTLAAVGNASTLFDQLAGSAGSAGSVTSAATVSAAGAEGDPLGADLGTGLGNIDDGVALASVDLMPIVLALIAQVSSFITQFAQDYFLGQQDQKEEQWNKYVEIVNQLKAIWNDPNTEASGISIDGGKGKDDIFFVGHHSMIGGGADDDTFHIVAHDMAFSKYYENVNDIPGGLEVMPDGFVELAKLNETSAGAIFGGTGNDTFYVELERSALAAGNGDDKILDSSFKDCVFTSITNWVDGAAYIKSEKGYSAISTGYGNDTATNISLNHTAFSMGDGNDTLELKDAAVNCIFTGVQQEFATGYYIKTITNGISGIGLGGVTFKAMDDGKVFNPLENDIDILRGVNGAQATIKSSAVSTGYGNDEIDADIFDSGWGGSKLGMVIEYDTKFSVIARETNAWSGINLGFDDDTLKGNVERSAVAFGGGNDHFYGDITDAAGGEVDRTYSDDYYIKAERNGFAGFSMGGPIDAIQDKDTIAGKDGKRSQITRSIVTTGFDEDIVEADIFGSAWWGSAGKAYEVDYNTHHSVTKSEVHAWAGVSLGQGNDTLKGTVNDSVVSLGQGNDQFFGNITNADGTAFDQVQRTYDGDYYIKSETNAFAGFSMGAPDGTEDDDDTIKGLDGAARAKITNALVSTGFGDDKVYANVENTAFSVSGGKAYSIEYNADLKKSSLSKEENAYTGISLGQGDDRFDGSAHNSVVSLGAGDDKFYGDAWNDDGVVFDGVERTYNGGYYIKSESHAFAGISLGSPGSDGSDKDEIKGVDGTGAANIYNTVLSTGFDKDFAQANIENCAFSKNVDGNFYSVEYDDTLSVVKSETHAWAGVSFGQGDDELDGTVKTSVVSFGAGNDTFMGDIWGAVFGGVDRTYKDKYFIVSETNAFTGVSMGAPADGKPGEDKDTLFGLAAPAQIDFSVVSTGFDEDFIWADIRDSAFGGKAIGGVVNYNTDLSFTKTETNVWTGISTGQGKDILTGTVTRSTVSMGEGGDTFLGDITDAVFGGVQRAYSGNYFIATETNGFSGFSTGAPGLKDSDQDTIAGLNGPRAQIVHSVVSTGVDDDTVTADVSNSAFSENNGGSLSYVYNTGLSVLAKETHAWTGLSLGQGDDKFFGTISNSVASFGDGNDTLTGDIRDAVFDGVQRTYRGGPGGYYITAERNGFAGVSMGAPDDGTPDDDIIVGLNGGRSQITHSVVSTGFGKDQITADVRNSAFNKNKNGSFLQTDYDPAQSLVVFEQFAYTGISTGQGDDTFTGTVDSSVLSMGSGNDKFFGNIFNAAFGGINRVYAADSPIASEINAIQGVSLGSPVRAGVGADTDDDLIAGLGGVGTFAIIDPSVWSTGIGNDIVFANMTDCALGGIAVGAVTDYNGNLSFLAREVNTYVGGSTGEGDDQYFGDVVRSALSMGNGNDWFKGTITDSGFGGDIARTYQPDYYIQSEVNAFSGVGLGSPARNGVGGTDNDLVDATVTRSVLTTGIGNDQVRGDLVDCAIGGRTYGTTITYAADYWTLQERNVFTGVSLGDDNDYYKGTATRSVLSMGRGDDLFDATANACAFQGVDTDYNPLQFDTLRELNGLAGISLGDGNDQAFGTVTLSYFSMGQGNDTFSGSINQCAFAGIERFYVFGASTAVHEVNAFSGFSAGDGDDNVKAAVTQSVVSMGRGNDVFDGALINCAFGNTERWNDPTATSLVHEVNAVTGFSAGDGADKLSGQIIASVVSMGRGNDWLNAIVSGAAITNATRNEYDPAQGTLFVTTNVINGVSMGDGDDVALVTLDTSVLDMGRGNDTVGGTSKGASIAGSSSFYTDHSTGNVVGIGLGAGNDVAVFAQLGDLAGVIDLPVDLGDAKYAGGRMDKSVLTGGDDDDIIVVRGDDNAFVTTSLYTDRTEVNELGISGDGGDDTIKVIGDRNVVSGGAGKDKITVEGSDYKFATTVTSYDTNGKATGSVDSWTGVAGGDDDDTIDVRGAGGAHTSGTVITGGDGADAITALIDDARFDVVHKDQDGKETSRSTIGVDAGAGDDTLTITGDRNVLDAGTGKDTIVVTGTGNEIHGGKDDDTITSDKGANVLTFDVGDGNDTVTIGKDASGDKVRYGSGVDDTEDVWFKKSGDDLEVVIGKWTGNSITFSDSQTIKGWYGDSGVAAGSGFSGFEVASLGMNLSTSSVEQLVQAMASFDVQPTGTVTLSDEQRQHLHDVIAPAWHP